MKLVWGVASPLLGILVFFVALPCLGDVSPMWERLSPFPLATEVVAAARHESGLLTEATVVTVQQFVLAAAAGLCIGIILSVGFALWASVRNLLGPWVRIVQITPAIIWIPFLLRVPGIASHPFLIPPALGALVGAAYVLVHVADSLTRTEKGEATYAAGQKADWRWRFRFMCWPRVLEGVVASMQIGGSVALILVVVGDALVRTDGLGQLIQDYQTAYAGAEVAAVFVMLALLALAYGALSQGVHRFVWGEQA